MGNPVSGPRRPAHVVVLPFLLLVASVVLSTVASPSRAGTLRALGLDQLATDADVVAFGRVVGLRPDWLGDIPATEVTLEVAAAFKGQPGAAVRFDVLGGALGSRMAWVDGEARFRVGEQALVFLERSTASGRTWVMGGAQGRCGVTDGRLDATGLPLAAFAERLRARLAGSRAPLTLDLAPGVATRGGRPRGRPGANPASATGEGPRITGISPEVVGSAADQPLCITIRGERFGGEIGRVRFPDWFSRRDGAVVSWSDTMMVVVPPVPDTRLEVEVTSGVLEVQDAGGRSSLEPGGCLLYSCHPPGYLQVIYNYPAFLWKDPALPVRYAFNPEGMPAACGEQAVRRGFAGWDSVETSRFCFAWDGFTAARPGEEDGWNTVGALSPWPFSRAWVAVTVAHACYEGSTDTAVIYECDTAFNTDGHPFACSGRVTASQADLETVALHEAGHWLRLRHVNTEAEIMRAASLLGHACARLGPGDRMGASHIYPGYGSVRVLRERVTLCPAGDADSVVLRVAACDREGRPLAGLPADSVWAEAGGATASRAAACAPTDSQGVTRVVLRSLSGRDSPRPLRARAGGRDLAVRAVLTAASLDLSGDGRVGPEDLDLARELLGRGAAPAGLPDTGAIRAHLGHRSPGLPAGGVRPPSGVLSISPTPFHEICYVSFAGGVEGPAEVDVLDVTGARVRRLWAGRLSAGMHSWAWDGTGDAGCAVASGIYLARVRQAGKAVVRKILLIR
jgi:hypothetical protein